MDAVNPRLSQGWLDYAQQTGLVMDPARIRSPKDKPSVERALQNVLGTTGLVRNSLISPRRNNGRSEVFDGDEAPMLLPVLSTYDVPGFRQVKVHRDFHAEVAKALYSIPGQWIGSVLDGRFDWCRPDRPSQNTQIRRPQGHLALATRPGPPAPTQPRRVPSCRCPARGEFGADPFDIGARWIRVLGKGAKERRVPLEWSCPHCR